MVRSLESNSNRFTGPTHLFLADLNERHHGWVNLRSEGPSSDVRVFKDGVLVRLEDDHGNIIKRFD